MKDVFLLGAECSKAISSSMTVTKELSREILEQCEFKEPSPPQILGMIEKDFEKVLTFLAVGKPWLVESDKLAEEIKELAGETSSRIV